jgi:demethylmenaquinone methyltransferase/2-methoxy-6-polyprenyl-1,4-benzoquinol methylase
MYQKTGRQKDIRVYVMDKKDFFNAKAEQWDVQTPHDMAKVELLIQLLGIKQGHRLLDAGTGTGVLVPVLSRYTGEKNINAIDIAEKMINLAKQKFSAAQITFITGDALTYPFETESFDHVICFSVFPHFDDKLKALNRFSDLLCPGGLLSILHSQSRMKINSVHTHIRHMPVQSDSLPSMDAVAQAMRRCRLNPEIMIENEDMYAVCGRKI